MSNFPTAIDDGTSLPNPGANSFTNSPTHAGLHTSENGAIIAVETKLGTGSSTASAGKVLVATGTGSSAWAQLDLTSTVTGALPVAHGGSGATTLTGVIIGNGTSAFTAVTAPSGAIVGTTDSQTLTNKIITAPQINLIEDTNGLEILDLTPTASAVNHLNISNSVTGVAPLLQSEGSDSNIGLHIAAKGTSSPHFFGIYDGWNNPNESWSFASVDNTNHWCTITVPSGAATKYVAGDRVKFTDNSVVVMGIIQIVADTLLTVYVGPNYALNNSAITSNFYSHEASPVGFDKKSANWAITFTSTSTSSISLSQWANPSGFNLPVPPGTWNIIARVSADGTRTSTTAMAMSGALSESQTSVTSGYGIGIDSYTTGGATGSQRLAPTFKCAITKSYTSLTTVYFIIFPTATSAALATGATTDLVHLLSATNGYI